MDLTKSIEPKSDQLNADDIIAGPVTVTIERVTEGSIEQPVDVHLVEFPGRPYRPSKSMRRVMVSAWGKEAAEYAGRRMTLYRDPEVTFGRDKVGGIKISHLSHIEKRMSLALTVTRGKRSPHVVEPLTEAAPQPLPRDPDAFLVEPTAEQVAACTDVGTLKGMWRASGPERREQITARVAELKAAPEPNEDDPNFPSGDAA